MSDIQPIKQPKRTVTIYSVNGNTVEWGRTELIKFAKERAGEHHFDDIADFIIFQIEQNYKPPLSPENLTG